MTNRHPSNYHSDQDIECTPHRTPPSHRSNHCPCKNSFISIVLNVFVLYVKNPKVFTFCVLCIISIKCLKFIHVIAYI